MQLTQSEERMIASYRQLPQSAATQVATLIERLAHKNSDIRVDWSEEWSDEDLLDLNRASLDLIEEDEKGLHP